MRSEDGTMREAEPDRNGGQSTWFQRLPKVVHLLFWTAVFYGLTYGIARLCEWLSP